MAQAIDTTRTKTAVSSADVRSLWMRWQRYLQEPVDGSSLALFRILFGVIMLWEVWRYVSKGWIDRYYIDPTFFFSYVPFIRPWEGEGMYWHFGLLGLLSVMMALGLHYRIASILFFPAFTYVFLLDKTQYLNHFYLISLISLLLAIVPAHRAWSLDRLRSRDTSPGMVPRWSLAILRAQIVVVYFYGGIAKLNPDWLQGQPIGMWLAQNSDSSILGPLLVQKWTGLVFAYGGLVVDLSVGFLLLFRRTFWLGVIIVLMFNLINADVFQIGIFPFFMIGALVLFPRPDWPRRLLDGKQPQKRVRRKNHQKTDSTAPLPEEILPTSRRRMPVFELGSGVLIILVLHLYLAANLTVPLRHWLYPSNVNWSEEGHRFSWRMKLRDKSVNLAMFATNPQTGERTEIDFDEWLTDRQRRKMSARPDMILQFAHYYADRYEEQHGIRPIVNARAYASLNGRPPQVMIDFEVDLASQPVTLGASAWILPLEDD
ncbi:MAG: hypothetical protein GFH27_549291n167 [Chloroflexi bacterium AL-W]|nr:hypothetical protein [Chloroflexi bacterium AL-N1]NOK67366.1 hypothetical protein [Chloroflexi bacterium AL-N10]NOK75142.1 hypothetical protein [Chloroflexi bacterium AL-N5]NOK81929.1 hypothetical protein [Chloroflexi bacterium AL-W]NOK89775.1 hypothetical protein [Chloroflexi bacterium AL-N15]